MKKKLLILCVAILMSVGAVVYAQSKSWRVTASCYSCGYSRSVVTPSSRGDYNYHVNWAKRNGLPTTHRCANANGAEIDLSINAE